MKTHFILYFLFLTSLAYSQEKEPNYLFAILKPGFCDDTPSKECKKKQIDYLTACEKIGDYFYSSKVYDSALYYYSLPATLNDHSVIFQSAFARSLRNKIISKAGDMIMDGVGTKKDTLLAYYYHYQFPLSKSEANKLSLKYFKKVDGILNLGRYDDTKGFYWQFEINPFMILDTITLNKVISKIQNISASQKSINLKFIGESPGEEPGALYYSSLNYIKKAIKKGNSQKKISLDVEYGGSHLYLSKIAIPLLQVSFN